MELRDFLVTPIVIIIIYALAYLIRPRVTDEITKRYFIPALTVRILGALAVGFIYQFYYSGGDTFNFHTHGSRHVWEAFMDDPSMGIDMLLSDGTHKGSFYKYSSRIYFFSDAPSYFVIRFAAVLDLFTFSAYSATAILFSVFSFIGAWMLFVTFYSRYPNLHKWMALAVLFIPSVFFWGSGLLKDTLVLAAIGTSTYTIDRLFIQKKISLVNIFVLLFSLFFIFSIKKFVLQAFLPASILWVYMANMARISSMVMRVMLFPFVIAISIFLAYYAVIKVGEGDVRYDVNVIAQTARTTAIDIRYLTGKDAGSGYSLGELDGTFTGMLRLAPAAINVALFRPYLWEVRNSLMLLSAFESILFLFITLYVFHKRKFGVFKSFSNPDIVFCFVFAIVFAFAVGVSTFNFGTLARYKIPLMPFYAIGLILILYSNNDEKVDELEDTE